MQFNSANQRILVLSDVHQDILKLKLILAKESYDTVLVLGDWFDSFDYDSDEHVRAACQFLLDNLDNPNLHTLIGNHDTHYLYTNRHLPCSGWEERKAKIVRQTLGARLGDVRKKFKWFFWADDYLCTHAGLHRAHFPPNLKLTKQDLTVWLNDQADFADRNILAGEHHWFYLAGKARYGRAPYGGLTWLDFNSEFDPIPEIKQLVGHTPHDRITSHLRGNIELATAHDLDIDCHLIQYLIIQNGKIEIKKTMDLY